jgi:hypothetical protein
VTPNCYECDDRAGIIKHRRQWYCVQCYDEGTLDGNYFDNRSSLGRKDFVGGRSDGGVEV